ncbi:peptide methionine sulfoxide reductase [Flavivirga aquatica]|uniref:peptide-methionine (S)-S-oxide reductase n=1 Tax=Flavivirga aquatica TaxID=1849968 RepID=A0A1E5T8W4_9FLAO|nr:peptide-methionine (S)-S-oxide reductase [Flavivirga aquatica]OEK07811.1 peptide methionine sulfoxide reductase [Flavivirga aquatica]
MSQKIALGGGCHWCTEAVYQSLKGVTKVEQGYVASVNDNNTFSEAVIVHFNVKEISLKTLIKVHLYTHKSTSSHSMRDKYRSAIYTFSEKQKEDVSIILEGFQNLFENKLIIKVLLFNTFKASREQIANYYYKNPNKPFCKTFINPKLKLVLNRFSKHADKAKLNHLIE